MMKTCNVCLVEKELSNFKSNGYTPNGTKKIKPHCLACELKGKQQRHNALLQEFVELRCILCGYDRCASALDFHHLDPTKKEFGIRGNGRSMNRERVKQELAKCVVLCCRCHREVHAGVTELPNNESNGAIGRPTRL